MASIHFVERKGNTHKIKGTDHEYDCGYWAVSKDTAEKLVGGDLYLHSGQKEPSKFGGRILSFRVHEGGDIDGRIIFRIQFSSEYRGVTIKEGWGNEKNIIW